MPSFTSLATLALTLLSATSALALGSAEAETGSVFEKRWNNHGKQCAPSKKGWCKTDVAHGYSWCGHSGKHYTCQWACNKGYSKHGSKCLPVKTHKPATCNKHHHCSTHVKNAWAYCNSGKCTYHCDKGYHSSKGACVKTAKVVKCGHKTCPTVEGGYATCANPKTGKCEEHCDKHTGASLYTNSHNTAYRCINVKNDVNNCGKPGYKCHKGYHGGEPKCYNGKCTLDCKGYQVKKTHSGVLYCSNKKA